MKECVIEDLVIRPVDMDNMGSQGTIKQLLADNMGRTITADTAMVDGTIISKSGVLYGVGNNYVVLKTPCGYTTIDLYAIRFVHFHPTCKEI